MFFIVFVLMMGAGCLLPFKWQWRAALERAM